MDLGGGPFYTTLRWTNDGGPQSLDTDMALSPPSLRVGDAVLGGSLLDAGESRLFGEGLLLPERLRSLARRGEASLRLGGETERAGLMDAESLRRRGGGERDSR